MAIHSVEIAANTLGTTAGKNAYRYIPGRLILKVNTFTQSVVGAGSANQTGPTITYDNDILMASFYHAAGAKVDGTEWCTAWGQVAGKDGKEVTSTVNMGWGGATKCTFQFISDDKAYAPAVKMTTSDNLNFYFQFIEWISPAAFGTNAAMPTADDTTYQIGKLAPGTNKHVYLNPQTVTSAAGNVWLAHTLTSVSVPDPEAYYPGSIGEVAYFPALEGPSKTTQVIAVDASVILDRFAFVSSVFNDYSGKLTTFNGDKTTYDDAAQKEADRRADFFKAMFDPPVTVPTKPCPPTQPKDYSGVTIDLAKSIADGWLAQDKQGMLANIKVRTDTYAHEDRFHSRKGYALSGPDKSKTGAIANIGHVWGRFGEGAATMYDTVKPFRYTKEDSAHLPGLQISVFPELLATTALATGKKTEFTAKSQTFASYDMYKVATRPGAATPASTVLDGASTLVATGLAAAAVIATIA